MNCRFPTVEIVASIAARVKHRAKQNPIVFPLLYFNNLYKFYNKCSLNIVVKCQIAFTTRITTATSFVECVRLGLAIQTDSY